MDLARLGFAGHHQDFHLADVKMLSELVLPFLADADQRQERPSSIVRAALDELAMCAAWLVSFRDMSNTEAIDAVKRRWKERTRVW